jgi:hypothetical protein
LLVAGAVLINHGRQGIAKREIHLFLNWRTRSYSGQKAVIAGWLLMAVGVFELFAGENPTPFPRRIGFVWYDGGKSPALFFILCPLRLLPTETPFGGSNR